MKLRAKGLVVLTGGEPLRQNITQLANELLLAGYTVQVETNGTIFLKDFPYEQVHLVCSPKSTQIHPKIIQHITAFKYLCKVTDPTIGGIPETLSHPPKKYAGNIYLQPLDDEQLVQNTAFVVALAKQFGHIVCLQLHKYLGVH
jgi:7-carboxy-7-deazaguanine synthase